MKREGTRRRASIALVAFSGVVLVICSIPVFGTRFLNDMEFYSLFADKLLAGHLLYRDAMDTKPPLVFLHYALVFELFGRDNMTAVKVVTMIWLASSAAALVGLGRALSSSSCPPIVVAPLFLLVSFSGWGEDFLSTNTELLANLFIIAGAALLVCHGFRFRPLDALAGGCMVGVACLYRYQSGAALLAYAGTVILRGRELDHPVARLLLVGAGAILPVLLVVALYARLGALPDLRLLLAYQAHYAHDGDPLSLRRALGRVSLALAGLWPTVIVAAWRTAVTVRRPGRKTPAEVFLLLFTAFSLVGFAAGARFFPHYFVQVIPPIVLLATGCVSSPHGHQTAELTRTRFFRGAFALQVTSAMVFLMVNGFYYRTRKNPPPHPDLVAFVETHTDQNEEILLWTWRPDLLLETKRVFATRLLANEVLIGRLDLPSSNCSPPSRRRGLAELWPVYLHDLTSKPPKLIFDAAPGESLWPFASFAPLAAVLSRYHPCRVIEGVCVYLRRD